MHSNKRNKRLLKASIYFLLLWVALLGFNQVFMVDYSPLMSVIYGALIAAIAMMMSSYRLNLSPVTSDANQLYLVVLRALTTKWVLLMVLTALVLWKFPEIKQMPLIGWFLVGMALQIIAGTIVAVLVSR